MRLGSRAATLTVVCALASGCATPLGPQINLELVRSERPPALTPNAQRLARLAARARESVVQIRSDHHTVKPFVTYLGGIAEGLSSVMMPHPYWEWPYRVLVFPFYLMFGYLDMGTSWGTGFYVGPDLVLTNAHVLVNSREITVRLQDGRRAKASIVAVDRLRDVALIRVQRLPNRRPVSRGVKAPTEQPLALPPPAPLRLRRSPARPGEPVMVVGFPTRDVLEDPNLPRVRFDPRRIRPNPRITVGIVSARDVHLGNPFTRYVETDAALNPGNSGGPIMGLDGSVIGVAAMVGIGKENEGFAIPALTVLATFKKQLAEEPAQRTTAPAPKPTTTKGAPGPEPGKGKRG